MAAKLVAKYGGLDVVNVSKGDPVMIGATIGTLGKVPCEGLLKVIFILKQGLTVQV